MNKKNKIYPPIMNASGPKSITEEDLRDVAKSGAGAVITKSMSHCPREGNKKPRLKKRLDYEIGSLNSEGLPNLGFERYKEIIPKLKEEYDKTIIASIAAADCEHNHSLKEQYIVIAEAMEECGADRLEINISCPNIGKEPIGYDPESTFDLLNEIDSEVNIPVGVKIPPYNNMEALFYEVADALEESGIDSITTMNSEPNCMDIDLENREKVIRPHNGYGGYGGAGIYPIALAEVNRFYEYFKERGDDIKIFGVGGIKSSDQAIKHFLAGADYVQIGTSIMNKGTGILKKIWKDVEDYMEDKGYETINDLTGAVEESRGN